MKNLKEIYIEIDIKFKWTRNSHELEHQINEFEPPVTTPPSKGDSSNISNTVDGLMLSSDRSTELPGNVLSFRRLHKCLLSAKPLPSDPSSRLEIAAPGRNTGGTG